MPAETPAALPERTERFLTRLQLLAMFWLFLAELGHEVGFDAGAHIEMLNLITWAHPETALKGSFYGYHPPMGFLLPRTLHLLGFVPEVSVQIISFLAGLAAFFFLRLTLKEISALRTPRGTAFLVLSTGLPLSVYLLHSVNLDILILAEGAIVLFCCTRLFLRERPEELSCGDRWMAWFGLLSTLSFAMLTKFSGVLLLALPPIAAVVGCRSRQWLPRLAKVAVVILLALAMGLPYYGVRYYLSERTFFPNNGDWMVSGAFVEARTKRNTDPIGFFANLFAPNPVHREKGLAHRDYDVLRLSDTWRDYWLKDQFLGSSVPFSLELGSVYFFTAPWLLVLGGVALLRRRMDFTVPWRRLGRVVLLFGLFQFAALLVYLTLNPFAGWGPAKAIYIAPTIWGIAYLLTGLVPRDPLNARQQRTFAVLLVGFTLLNFILPVY